MSFPVRGHKPLYGERLVVIRESGSIALPYPYSLEGSTSISWRVKDEQRGFAHGGTAYGDKKIDSKKIKISIYLRGETEEEHDRMFNELLILFSNGRFNLSCGRPDRAYHIESIAEVKSKYITGYKQRWSDVEFTFLLTDPFRYAVNATTLHKTFTEDQSEGKIMLQNPSSVDVPLVIRFTPANGKTTSDIRLYHQETDQYFTLKDSLLTYPAVATVNAEAGTVRRGSYNSLNTFAGIFFHAEPGPNTFLYTGGAVKVAIQFTARWLV